MTSGAALALMRHFLRNDSTAKRFVLTLRLVSGTLSPQRNPKQSESVASCHKVGFRLREVIGG